MSIMQVNLDGFYLIDKPKGISSFEVVKRVRKLTGIEKVGHAGTLDPLASGLMIVAVGQATKFLQYLLGLDKEYEGEAIFGAVSETYDSEGPIKHMDLSEDFSLSLEKVRNTIDQEFSSMIEQAPPLYSARKKDGKRAYVLARRGKSFELSSSSVEIKNFAVEHFFYPNLKFRVLVSSGTYIRSLLHDLGTELTCGAYVNELRRTKIASFDISESIGLDVLMNDFLEPAKSLKPITEIMFRVLPSLYVSAYQKQKLLFGQTVLMADVEAEPLPDGRMVNDKFPGVYLTFYSDELLGVVHFLGENYYKLKKGIAY